MHRSYNKYETYGLWGMVKMFYYLVLTKILFPRARLIRFPIEVRGKRFIDFGDNLTTGMGCRIEAIPFYSPKMIIKFGKNVQINDFVHITAMENVYIGNNVLLASKIYISDCSHGSYEGNENDSSPDIIAIKREYKTSAVRIEDNVWIGESVSILPGTTIGENSIVGANSVVTKDIPKNCIAVGNPARVIKKFNFETKKWEKI